MRYLRSNRGQSLYEAHKQEREAQGATDCEMCSKEHIQTFNYWALVPNLFPYDLIAEKSDMLIPLRHANSRELTDEEWSEYRHIINEILFPLYDITIESMIGNQTIPDHFHVHLLVCKDSYPELGGV